MSSEHDQKEITLNWQGSVTGFYYQLTDSRLIYTIPEELFGVYVVWEFVAPGNRIIVKVGKGKIRKNLSAHMKDEKIIGNGSKLHILLVEWAEVDPKYVDGVEAYLDRVLTPQVGERFSDVKEVVVNLPF